MNLLAIDASTERASVALLTAGVVSEQEQPVPKQHAQVLLPVIQALMNHAGLEFNQLQGIVFGQGPGSFTGLRIACSIAKGLAFAHNLPVYPCITLAAMADEARVAHPSLSALTVLACMDARMDQVYWACYGGECDESPRVSNPDELFVPGDGPILLASCAFDSYRSRLPSAILARIQTEQTCYPGAAAMLRMATMGKLIKMTAASAVPVYVRNQIVQGDSRG